MACRKEDDGLIEREKTAPGSQMHTTTSYYIYIKTGDVPGAGTDANVYLIIFGTKGDNGDLQMRQSLTYTNKFERGNVDIFKIEAADIGEIMKIRIGHDDSKPSGWFLDEVKILMPSQGEQYIFACNRWLSKEKEDGQLEVELVHPQKEPKSTIPCVIKVQTGSDPTAGTYTPVHITLKGEGQDTGPLRLTETISGKPPFKSGQLDEFLKEVESIGALVSIRIGLYNSTVPRDWFLEWVQINNLTFSHSNWLGTGNDETILIPSRQHME